MWWRGGDLAVPETNQARDIINRAVLTVDKFFYVFIIFLIMTLLLKIFIQIRKQHPHIIGYTLGVIILAMVLVVGKLHFIEQLVGKVMEIV